MKLLAYMSLLFLSTGKLLNLLYNYKTYCNARFKYCIDYPTFLIPETESENGDGRIFVKKEGTKVLTVYGRLNRDANGDPVSLKDQYALDIKSLAALKNKITYQKSGKDFYVVSGIKKDRIFYRKMILKADAYCYSILEYNQLAKDVYDSVSANIFKSFK